jgi:hypothetical protein
MVTLSIGLGPKTAIRPPDIPIGQVARESGSPSSALAINTGTVA